MSRRNLIILLVVGLAVVAIVLPALLRREQYVTPQATLVYEQALADGRPMMIIFTSDL